MVEIQDLRYAYGERPVLQGLSFQVPRGEIFGLLGPNGSGKTTLFRILCTAFPPGSGVVKIHGLQIPRDYGEIRKKIGIVFQSPSLDAKLTVRENLIHQGHLYGLCGGELAKRIEEMMGRLGIQDRAGERVDKLSGGLKRRAELAKGLLHRPSLLILDEPSTGLDPGARIDLWRYLKNLREGEGMTILVTTHLMEEAELCDSVAILNHGKIVSLGSPDALKKTIGGDVIVVKTKNLVELAQKIKHKFNLEALISEDNLQIEHPHAAGFIARFAEAFPGEVESIVFRKPSLEDVFLHKTGHRFWSEEEVVSFRRGEATEKPLSLKSEISRPTASK